MCGYSWIDSKNKNTRSNCKGEHFSDRVWAGYIAALRLV